MDLSLLPVGVDFSHYAVRLSLNLVDGGLIRRGLCDPDIRDDTFRKKIVCKPFSPFYHVTDMIESWGKKTSLPLLAIISVPPMPSGGFKNFY